MSSLISAKQSFEVSPSEHGSLSVTDTKVAVVLENVGFGSIRLF